MRALAVTAALLWTGVAHAATWERVESARDDEGFTLPSPETRLELTALAAALTRDAVRGELDPSLSARAAALGLRLDVADGVAWLADAEETRRGTGLLAVRIGPMPAELVLQAPHPFYDLGTGPIVALMFDEGLARAAMLATVHRKAASASDASHSPEGGFQALTVGVAQALTDPLFVQLHGFGGSTSDAQLVVSEGSARWWKLPEVGAAVGAALGATDVRFGQDEPALAARQNVQGMVLADTSRFLHLELDKASRDALKEDAARRLALADALRKVVATP